MLQCKPLQNRANRMIHILRIVPKEPVDQHSIIKWAVKVRDRPLLMEQDKTAHSPLSSEPHHLVEKLLRIRQPSIQKLFLIRNFGNSTSQFIELGHFLR